MISSKGLVLDMSVKLQETGRNIIRDKSRHENHGTCYGAKIIQMNEQIPVMNFDGNEYVDCGNNESLNITDAITIEAYVNIKLMVNQKIITRVKGSYWGGYSLSNVCLRWKNPAWGLQRIV